jgi:hypothetical protein
MNTPMGDKSKVIERHLEIARHLAERPPTEPAVVRFLPQGQQNAAGYSRGPTLLSVRSACAFWASDLDGR